MPSRGTLPVGTAGRALPLGAPSAFTSGVVQSVWRGSVPLNGIDLSDQSAMRGARGLIPMQQAVCLADDFIDGLAQRRPGGLGLRGLAPSVLEVPATPRVSIVTTEEQGGLGGPPLVFNHLKWCVR